METKQATYRLVEHQEGGHQLRIQNIYLVCEQCGMRTLRNSAREKIQQLHQSACWNGKWELPRQRAGHPTHEMWRRANCVQRKQCHACAI